jgi:CRISPR-associated exonuclease Cas4
MQNDNLVMISALQHWSYCPRQCGLIHLEQIFDENLFTLKGSNAHERADEPETRMENGVRIERALPLWSERLGLIGKGDVVEFHPEGQIIPVEYKSGPRRESLHDNIQLCAQGLCLEEIYRKDVTEGAIYSLTTHRRRLVPLDEELRDMTYQAIQEVRQMQEKRQVLPPAVNDKRCPKCSLIDACMPATVVAVRSSHQYADLFVPKDSL